MSPGEEARPPWTGNPQHAIGAALLSSTILFSKPLPKPSYLKFPASEDTFWQSSAHTCLSASESSLCHCFQRVLVLLARLDTSNASKKTSAPEKLGCFASGTTKLLGCTYSKHSGGLWRSRYKHRIATVCSCPLHRTVLLEGQHCWTHNRDLLYAHCVTEKGTGWWLPPSQEDRVRPFLSPEHSQQTAGVASALLNKNNFLKHHYKLIYHKPSKPHEAEKSAHLLPSFSCSTGSLIWSIFSSCFADALYFQRITSAALSCQVPKQSHIHISECCSRQEEPTWVLAVFSEFEVPVPWVSGAKPLPHTSIQSLE